jgi:hypothetical protein
MIADSENHDDSSAQLSTVRECGVNFDRTPKLRVCRDECQGALLYWRVDSGWCSAHKLAIKKGMV